MLYIRYVQFQIDLNFINVIRTILRNTYNMYITFYILICQYIMCFILYVTYVQFQIDLEFYEYNHDSFT